jgi:hypothetical protein
LKRNFFSVGLREAKRQHGKVFVKWQLRPEQNSECGERIEQNEIRNTKSGKFTKRMPQTKQRYNISNYF